MKFSLFFGLAISVLAATNAQIKVVCYWASWSPDVLNYFDSNLCTHLIYSFVNIQNDGSVTDGDYPMLYFQNIKNTYPNLKLLISGGGESFDPNIFSNIAASPTLSNTLANNLLTFIQQYNLDGFDLDWEYPETSADTINMNLLLTKIRNVFNSSLRPLLLTVAVGPDKSRTDKSYLIPQLSQLVDFINMMTYDLNGAWDKITGLPSALYSDPAGYLSDDSCVTYWLSKGVPSSKLVLGIPTYGTQYTLTTSDYGVNAPASLKSTIPAYNELCLNNWTEAFVPSMQVPYAYSGKKWISYENQASLLAKVSYIKSKNLGGAMFWSLDQDDYKKVCPKSATSFPLIRTVYNALVSGQTSVTTQAPTTAAPTTKAPTTKAPTTQAPTTVAPTTKAAAKDTSICTNTKKLYDASKTYYLKSACLVASAVNFATAQTSCTSHGMQLFVFDTLSSASTLAFVPYADSFVGIKYPNPYRVWISYGQCRDFANNAGVYTVSAQPCTDTMYFFCEFF